MFMQLLEEGINVKLVYWYQEMSVLWNNVRSDAFGNGNKQGVRSP